MFRSSGFPSYFQVGHGINGKWYVREVINGETYRTIVQPFDTRDEAVAAAESGTVDVEWEPGAINYAHPQARPQ